MTVLQTDILFFFVGLQTTQLALYKELFSEYIHVAKFQIRLQITNDITLAVGKASLNLLRNTPPYGGACIITPLVGVVSQTNFSAKCENFTDDDHEIVEYKITCKCFILFDIIRPFQTKSDHSGKSSY